MARFEEDVNIQPINPSTGAAQGLMSLADKLDAFSGQMAVQAANFAEKTGTDQGLQSASQLQEGEHPEFKDEGFFGGASKQAYNKSLRAAYVAGVDRDVQLGIEALTVQHSNDVNAFNEGVAGLMKGTLENAEPTSRAMIAQSAQNTIDSNRIIVQKNTIERTMAETKDSLLFSGEVYTKQADTYAFAGDQIASSEALVKSAQVNQQLVDTFQITEAEALRRNQAAIQSSRIQLNRGQMDNVMRGKDGIRQAAGAISALADNPLSNMSPEQNDELVTTLRSDLSAYISDQNRQEVADQATLTSRQANNYGNYLRMRAEGVLNQATLNEAQRTGAINASQYNTLTEKLSSQGVGVTDNRLKLFIQDQIQSGEDATDIIQYHWGTNLNDNDAGELLAENAEYSNSESVLNQNNTKRARKFVTESIKITGIMGRLTDRGAKKTAALTREFDQRVLDGEDPFMVADDLFNTNEQQILESNYSRKGYDVKNVSGALDKLTADYNAKLDNAAGNQTLIQTIDSEYDRDYTALTNLLQMQQNAENFKNIRKEMR